MPEHIPKSSRWTGRMDAIRSVIARELHEQACRPRMWMLRVAFAGLLLVFFIPGLFDAARGTPGLSGWIGTGGPLFSTLLKTLSLGTILFVPLLCVDAITGERERGTLDLLRIALPGSREVVWAKLASRLLAMLWLLLMSLPLTALAYALGGVELSEIAGGLGQVAAAMYVTATFSLLMSARARSTAGALLRIVFLLPVLGVFLGQLALFSLFAMSELGVPGWPGTHLVLILTPLLSGLYFMRAAARSVDDPGGEPVTLAGGFLHEVGASLVDFFHVVSGQHAWLGRVDSLPGDRPLEWLSPRARFLALPRLWFRALLVLSVPTAVPALIAVALPLEDLAGRENFSVLLGGYWIMCLMVITTHAALLIPTLRMRDQFDLIRAAPLSREAIVRQLMSGPRRLTWLLACPLLAVILMRSQPGPDVYALHAAGWLVFLLLTARLAGWIGFGVSMFSRSPLRAVLSAVGVTLAWFLGPWLIWDPLVRPWFSDRDLEGCVCLAFCPGFPGFYYEFHPPDVRIAWIVLLGGTVHPLLAGTLLSRSALRRARSEW